MYVLQTTSSKTDGRFFCVTGTEIRKYRPKASTVATSGGTGNDSDTSGYLSTSYDSLGEETRLAPCKEKIMSVWRCWVQHLDSCSGPLCSTPNPDSEQVVLKKCVRLSNFSRPLSALKRMPCPNSSEIDALIGDSCCRTYMAPSCSGDSIRNTGNMSMSKSVSGSGIKGSEGKVQFSFDGFSLDESMTECLSDVIREKLASFFQINDNVTTETNITQSKNDEIAYFKI